MLRRMVDEGLVTARAVYGFWPAARDGDDIVVYDEHHAAERLRFPMLLFCRFGAGGEVVEEHRYFDTAGILRQLGSTEH